MLRSRTAIRIAILLLLASTASKAPGWQISAPLAPHTPDRPSDPEIVKRIDAAVYERTNSLARHSVQEQYDIYRNGEASPSAQMTLQAVYSYTGGKDYTLTAQSGSHFLRTAVLDRV
jgi:hypothetical protein